jgi:hypothetical protein
MCIWGMLDSNLGQDPDFPQIIVVGPNHYPQTNFGPRLLSCTLSNFFSLLTSVDAMYLDLLIIRLVNDRCQCKLT